MPPASTAQPEAALGCDPDSPALQLQRGNVLASQKRFAEALAAYDAVQRLSPDYPTLQARRGIILRELGRLAEAQAALAVACAADPGNAVLRYGLGKVLHEQDRLDEAVTAYLVALRLKRDYVTAYADLGNALWTLGRTEEALAAYRAAVHFKPDFAEAHANLGAALLTLGRPEEAAAASEAALRLDPLNATAYSNLGAALHDLDRPAEAVPACRAALRLKPDFAVARSNLAAALLDLGAFEEALTACDEALRARVDCAEIHSNRGAALTALGRFEEAAADCETALRLNPDYAEAHSNLGTALRAMGRREDAVASYRAAIAVRADYPAAHTNLGMALLAGGGFAEGWREYEWRWRMKQPIAFYRESDPTRWHGEAAEGKTLLVFAEQGFGDTLQFCRYAPLLAARGLRVVMMVQPPLVRLLGSLEGVAQLVPMGEEPPPFDLQCPMLSLPQALGTTPDTIPAGVPYLRPDPAEVAAWRDRLDAPEFRGKRVGLAWAGNPRPSSPGAAAVDRRRSLAPELLAPLFDRPGVRFFNLQKDGPAAPAGFPLTDFMGEMHDFADTAALIAHLDLVISVDTAVVHLAGALGRPVWMLDRADSCWRWLTDRTDSPWYPGLRIFRQPGAGEWSPVVSEVAAALRV